MQPMYQEKVVIPGRVPGIQGAANTIDAVFAERLPERRNHGIHQLPKPVMDGTRARDGG